MYSILQHNTLRTLSTRLWQLLSTVIATLATHLAAIYLFTDAESVPRPLMGLFTFRLIEVSPIFSLGCIKTPRGDAPSLVPSFSTIII